MEMAAQIAAGMLAGRCVDAAKLTTPKYQEELAQHVVAIVDALFREVVSSQKIAHDGIGPCRSTFNPLYHVDSEKMVEFVRANANIRWADEPPAPKEQKRAGREKSSHSDSQITTKGAKGGSVRKKNNHSKRKTRQNHVDFEK